MSGARLIAVCVPARNEADRLPKLLGSLAVQTMPACVVVALNNTTDASHAAIVEVRRRHPMLDIVIDDVNFPPHLAHAGSARRRALEVGLQIVGQQGTLITTDADTRPPPYWIAANVSALERGLDVVGGQIRPDDDDMSPRLRAMMAMTARYWAQVRAIEDDIDPLSWDLPPRHGDHTGASLAFSASTYQQSGGVPPIASGEDRAFVRSICCAGGKLGHPADVWTRVSTRTRGRASAGMADDMARLAASERVLVPDFRHWRERARWRRDIRDRFGSAAVAVREDDLPAMPCDLALTLSEGADS